MGIKQTQNFFHTQELKEIIPIILRMLDVLHTLPFQTDWQKSNLTLTLIKMLKSAEQLTLTAWKSHQPQKFLQLWNASQKRNNASLLKLYYQFSELLLHWSEQIPKEWLGEKDLWQDYGFFVCMNDTKTKCYFNQLPYQNEQIAKYYLFNIQTIFQTHLEELVRRLFIWISHWTKENYFLPTLKKQSHSSKQDIHLSDMQKWKKQFFDSEDWRVFSTEYLTLIK